MDLLCIGVAVLFGISMWGLMRICEIPEERKPGEHA